MAKTDRISRTKENVWRGFEKETQLFVNQLFHNFENIVMDEAERHFCYYALDYDLFISCLNELK